MLRDAATWASSRLDLVGLVLVGSYARGTARTDSDVDLVLIAEDARVLLDDTAWTQNFGAVESREQKDYGLVQSVFTKYASGIEVEWGILPKGPPNGLARIAAETVLVHWRHTRHA
jgi:predicted nucleotidyltransferase